MDTLDIHSNKNWYLGYTHKQKSIITQNPHKTKKKYYKLVPWIFTQTKKYYKLVPWNTHKQKSFINWYLGYSHKQKKYYKWAPWIYTQTKKYYKLVPWI